MQLDVNRRFAGYFTSGMLTAGAESFALITTSLHSGRFAHSEIILPPEEACSTSLTSLARTALWLYPGRELQLD